MSRSSRLAGVLCSLAAAAILQFPLDASAQTEKILLRVEPGGHTAAARKIVFASRNGELISVGADKAVRVWDAESGKQTRTLRAFAGAGQAGELYAASLSPDERRLAIGGADELMLSQDAGAIDRAGKGCDIRIFDMASHTILRPVLTGHARAITALAYFSNDVLASASADGTARIWNPNTGSSRILKHGAYLYDVAFSPDGRQVATAGADGLVQIWEAQSGRKARSVNCKSEAKCLAWSPDGATLAIGTGSRRIILADPNTGKQIDTLSQTDDPTCLTFSRNGSQLLSGSGEHRAQADRRVRLWSVADRRLVREFPKQGECAGVVFSVAFSPDNAGIIAAGDASGAIYLWDLASGNLKTTLKGTGSSFYSVAWSPDGKKLGWGKSPGDGNNPAPLEQVFDLAAMRPRPNQPPGADWLRAKHAVAARTLEIVADRRSPQKLSVVISGGRGPVTIEHRDLEDDTDDVICASFVGEDRVAVGTNFRWHLFAITGNKPRRIKTYVGHDGPIQDLAPSPDGRFVATASQDQTVRIWSLSDKGRLIGITTNAVEPLVSVFSGSDDAWIAWTQPGFYTCSPTGDDIIGWQENHGRGDAADFHPAVRFSKTFYRPDVVSKVLATVDVKTALKVADTQQGRPPTDPDTTIVAHIPKLPVVKIVKIDPPAMQKADGSWTTDKPEAIVHVQITHPRPETVRLSGGFSIRPVSEAGVRNVMIGEPQAGGRDVTLRVPLRLSVLNTIRITGAGADGSQCEPDEVSIFCTALPPPDFNLLPKLYVLSIGVTKFRSPVMTQYPLYYPVKDAEAISAFYRGQEGKLFHKVVVTELLDQNATKLKILAALKSIQTAIRPNDMFIFYIASHGGPLDPIEGRVSDSNNFYLYPYEANPNKLAETGLPGKTLLESVETIDASILLILDTCHSGSLVNPDKQEQTDRLEQSITDFQHSARAKFHTLVACGPQEKSYEDDPSGLQGWRHGIFTLKILEALEQGVVAEPDGKKRLNMVARYVGTMVPESVKKQTGYSQHPQFYKALLADGDLPLAVGR